MAPDAGGIFVGESGELVVSAGNGAMEIAGQDGEFLLRSASSGVEESRPGRRFRFAAVGAGGRFGLTGFLCFFVVCARDVAEPTRRKERRQSRQRRRREEALGLEARLQASSARLAGFAGRGVGIFAESGGVTVGEDFHHPAIKVIHWVVHDGFESTVVFSMGFLNVIFQSDADISVFAAQFDLFRS